MKEVYNESRKMHKWSHKFKFSYVFIVEIYHFMSFKKETEGEKSPSKLTTIISIVKADFNGVRRKNKKCKYKLL